MRDSAILYDIENLVGGYGPDMHARAAAVCLRDVETRITAAAEPPLGTCAVKRAYADWSASGMRPLRGEIRKCGIDPRQTFAFGQGGRKNAADVELAIDVMELLFTRPAITHFVIVSADGGFGALVRTLHEHGKTVTVAAYPEKCGSGSVLPDICDTFVELPMPAAVAITCRPGKAAAPAAPTTDPAAARFTKLSEALPNAPVEPAREPDLQIAAMREILSSLTAHNGAASRLADGGITVAQLGRRLRVRRRRRGTRALRRAARPPRPGRRRDGSRARPRAWPRAPCGRVPGRRRPPGRLTAAERRGPS